VLAVTRPFWLQLVLEALTCPKIRSADASVVLGVLNWRTRSLLVSET
jgi:hypothetical protein